MKPLVLIASLFFSMTLVAQVGGWKPELKTNADKALAEMLEETPKLKTYKNQAYAYVVFPKVTKAGVGIGGAAGKGIVYVANEAVAQSKLKQASIGLQLGGQQYSEVIFFENKDAFEHFKNGN